MLLHHRLPAVLVIFSAFMFLCCEKTQTALIWTDRPEFALYGDYFNAAQNQYKVEIRYFAYPSDAIRNAAAQPDIVVGSWLKSASTRSFFRSLNGFLGAGKIPENAFYPRLLAIGKIEHTQYLLPVAFNIPAVIFAKDKGEQLPNPFTVGFDELKRLGKVYNSESKGAYTRMGFSPLWDDDFLYLSANLFNTSFREANPLAWDQAALDRAMRFVYEWTREINTNLQAEEDFTFKYFSDPPAKLVQSGRILFSSIRSDSLFTLAEERSGNLDFRWMAEQNTIPLSDGSVYMGLPKKGKAPRAAAAFVRWFFRNETQRLLLEKSKALRLSESSFGIGGGFSALRPVTEQIFPQFYPSLLGHMPPGDYLSPLNILPANWLVMKERIILPYLHDRARTDTKETVYPLEKRIADWLRANR